MKLDKTEIIQKAIDLIRDSTITNYKIAKDTSITETSIGNYKKGKSKPTLANANTIISYFENLDQIKDQVGNIDIIKIKGDEPDRANYRLVPVVHVDSVGGIYSNNEVSVTDSQYVEGYVPFVNAQEGDRAIFQTGNSMIPTCPPGSLLQIREVPNWREYFGYGNIFVIELTDGRRITKEVNRYDENPREFVWCKSHNPEVADEELPRSMINSVWKVIKILTDKGW